MNDASRRMKDFKAVVVYTFVSSSSTSVVVLRFQQVLPLVMATCGEIIAHGSHEL